jgi:hypothetical protein
VALEWLLSSRKTGCRPAIPAQLARSSLFSSSLNGTPWTVWDHGTPVLPNDHQLAAEAASADRTDRSTPDGLAPDSRTCARGHEPTTLELANTRGDRPGTIFECPQCGCAVIVTPGLLVGGSSERVLESTRR